MRGSAPGSTETGNDAHVHGKGWQTAHHHGTIQYAVNKRLTSSCSRCDRILMRPGVPRTHSETGNGKGEARGCGESRVRQLRKSVLWRAMKRSQADSNEAIHRLMEDREFSFASGGTGSLVITGEAREEGATCDTFPEDSFSGSQWPVSQ